ncbi:MAG: hypothetical protein N3F66_09660 [Spirochaetes bacterium]|nr:hypothetical protein [Spirochaetota bacterium]
MYTSYNFACQPGFNASCALCCGSHNYKASFSEIDALFKERLNFFRNKVAGCNDLTAILNECCKELSHITLPPLYPDATQCPFVAYTDTTYTTIGCLLYPYCTTFDYRSLFMGAICKTFNCSANTPDLQHKVITAAKACKDWYYYSIVIHDTKLCDEVITLHTQGKTIQSNIIKSRNVL